MDNEKAKKLVDVAIQQLQEGLEAKRNRMKTISSIIDLYNNKHVKLGDNSMNIPFPIMSNQIDSYYSKIDEPPALNFKIPNRKNLTEKVKQAFKQESSSTRGGWSKKDRAEKKMALKTGRGVAKLYSTSLNNKFKFCYDVVDIFNFVADPTRGDLEKGRYHGEVNIFKTKSFLKKMGEKGIYNKENVNKLLNWGISSVDEGEQQAQENIENRLRSLNIEVKNNAGAEGYNLCQWIMSYEDEFYYLLFDLKTGIWLRADTLKNVSDTGKTPYVSWAVNYDEYAFWTKGAGDDVLPTAEAMKFLLNNALENEKRRARPMRMVEAGSLTDVNELMDYIPDNVIISNTGRNAKIQTIETPTVSMTINLVEFLNNFIDTKSGVSGKGLDKPDTKVGIYYGELAESNDLIGTINKEYSESYTQKGYRFFWGLKKNMTENIALEMLGKGGVRLMELERMELSNIDDVDDVEVDGGSREAEVDAVEKERQAKAIADLSMAFPKQLNPKWIIKTTLKREGFSEEDVNQALDVDGGYDQELMNEADEAIQQILLGNYVELNQGATPEFMERIKDYASNNLNYVTLNSRGEEVKVDKKKKQQFNDLIAYMEAHMDIVVRNGQDKLREMETQMGMQEIGAMQEEMEVGSLPQVESPIPQGTPQGTAQMSQNITNNMSV